MKKVLIFAVVLPTLGILSCKTKSELRREQEFERLKTEVKDVKGSRADMESISEDLRREMARVSVQAEEQGQYQKNQLDLLKNEVTLLASRVQALEARSSTLSAQGPNEDSNQKTNRVGLDAAKKLFEEEKYEDAVEVLRGVIRAKPKSDDAKKAQFLIAESYFAGKDYASAVLEYSEYKKHYPKDSLVPNATYRQATAFRSMGKKTEAKLFYQELIERFPKHILSGKAKQDMKRLK